VTSAPPPDDSYIFADHLSRVGNMGESPKAARVDDIPRFIQEPATVEPTDKGADAPTLRDLALENVINAAGVLAREVQVALDYEAKPALARAIRAFELAEKIHAAVKQV
jgi:hypothetical protein